MTGTGGFETQYAEQGAGHPVLLLHGWGATGRIWRHLWPELVTKCRAMAPDLPGWGGSERPDAPYTPEWYAEWIGNFLDARFAPVADIVAHSMAGMPAAIFAARRPERVRRLVLSNVPVEGGTALSARSYFCAKPVVRWIVYQLLGLRSVRRWLARDFTYGTPMDELDVDSMNLGSYESLIRSALGVIGTNLRPHLTALRMPVLVVGSTHDAMVTPSQAEVASGTIVGARRVMLEECGHCPMLERPTEFSRAVVGFLGEGLPRRRPPGW